MSTQNVRVLVMAMEFCDGEVVAGCKYFKPRVKEGGHGSLVLEHEGKEEYIKKEASYGGYRLTLIWRQCIQGVETLREMTVKNSVLSRRIVEYLEQFYGNYRTNCSTFAGYLATGEFSECDIGKNGMMFPPGMNKYSGQSIKKGDIICVLYDKHFTKSEEFEIQKRKSWGRKEKSNLGRNGNFFSQEELAMFVSSGMIHEIHFLYCIGCDNGQPVFIQQMGLHLPEIHEAWSTPFCVMTGMRNPYPQMTPCAVLIKRGRK